MSTILEAARWLTDPAHWSGPNAIPLRVGEHLQISGVAVLVAAAVALPVGLLIGHTGRAAFLAVSVGNLGRALPSFGILGLVFPFTLRYLPGIGYWPTLIALILLAIPPILTNTYVGIRGVDADTIEAARGMGMGGRQVLRTLEVPLATPLIVAGLRTSAVQVVATATLGAVVGWGGLGRYIVDGFAQRDFGMTLSGAVLVALFAIATELAMALVQRIAAPRLTSRGGRALPSRAPEEMSLSS